MGAGAVLRVRTVPCRNPISNKASCHGYVLKMVEDDPSTSLVILGWTLGKQTIPDDAFLRRDMPISSVFSKSAK